jgi:hypothetical protein
LKQLKERLEHRTIPEVERYYMVICVCVFVDALLGVLSLSLFDVFRIVKTSQQSLCLK